MTKMTTRYNPLVLDRKTVFMQRIADYVRLGYRYWIAGEVALDRAASLVRKFDRLYSVGLNRNQRASAKRRGEGNCMLLLYSRYTGENSAYTAAKSRHVGEMTRYTASVQWVLLVSQGDHPAHTFEKLKDAWSKKERMLFTGYELLRLPRKEADEPAWTWRMTKETYQNWRDRILECVRKRTGDEGDIMASLAAAPGFAGIRSQVGHLVWLLRHEWTRQGRKKSLPALPELYYAQRLENRGMRLSAWVRLAPFNNQASPISESEEIALSALMG